MSRGSNAGRDKRFFSSPKRLDRLWGTPVSYLMGTRVFPRGLSGRGVMLTTHLHLMPKSRMSGAILLLPLPSICVNSVDRDNFTFLPLLFRHLLRETGKNHEESRNTRWHSRNSKLATAETRLGRCRYTELLGKGQPTQLQNNRMKQTPSSFALDVCSRLALASTVIDP
jgi:hypothetical protein